MLKQRIITAIILLVFLGVASYSFTPFSFAVSISIVVMLAAWEWGAFIGLENQSSKIFYVASIATLIGGGFGLLGITPTTETLHPDRIIVLCILGLLFWLCAIFMVMDFPKRATLWNKESKIAAMGLFALIPTWAGVVQLKYLEPNGFLVFSLIILVAAVDVGAYFSGVYLGKNKLAPELSPNKTWEGVWGGVALGLAAMALFSALVDQYFLGLSLIQMVVLFVISLFMSVFSVAGDLVESMLKRNRKIKDSGKILPGHGGILDRVDGLLAATPVFVLAMTYLLLGTN